MPRIPVFTRRLEEVFIPDPTSADEWVEERIERGTLYEDDTELSRTCVRELGRRRGGRMGVEGWWVAKEWEVVAIPDRKVLFLFGGEGKATMRAPTIAGLR
jgi:hypothetical protein